MAALLLARRSLSAHALRTTLTAGAVALGVAMLLAVMTIGHAASEDARAIASASARVDLEVLGQAGGMFDASVVDSVRSAPDVELAAPSLTVEARADGTDLRVRGVDPGSYAALAPDDDLAPLRSPGALLAPALIASERGWRTGRRLDLAAGARSAEATVAGRLREPGTPPTGAPVALAPLALAQELAGAPGMVDRVQVRLRDGADIRRARDALAALLGGGVVVARASLGDGVGFDAIGLRVLLGLVGAVMLLAAGFTVANAFGMGVTARTRELGALRTLGMTRRQVLGVVLAEAALVGAIGSLAGVALGLGLTWAALQATGQNAAPPPAWALVTAPALGVLMALLSALPPAARAGRTSPIEGLRTESRGGPRRSPPLRAPLLTLALLIAALGAFGALARPNLPTALAVLVPSMAALLCAVV